MQDLHRQLAEARRTFGQFLRNWRKSNGWVITTPQDWARACPDVIPPGFRVSSGQWANLENAQVRQAQPSTFLQLALLNQALAREKRGVISEALLRERVNAGRPIRKPDGMPWDAQDWFACYIGNLQGPEELWPQEPQVDLAEQTAQLRRLFLDLVVQQQLRPITAMVQLLGLGQELAIEQQMAIEGALLQDETLSAGDLAIAEALLLRWQKGQKGKGPASGRDRRRNDANASSPLLHSRERVTKR